MVPEAMDTKATGGGLLAPELVAVLRGFESFKFNNQFGTFRLVVDDESDSKSPVAGLPTARLRSASRTYARMLVAVDGDRLLFLPLELMPRADHVRSKGPRVEDLDRFGWGQALRVRSGAKHMTPLRNDEVRAFLGRLGAPMPELRIDPAPDLDETETRVVFRFHYRGAYWQAEARTQETATGSRAHLQKEGGRRLTARGVAREKQASTEWVFEFRPNRIGGPELLIFKLDGAGTWMERGVFAKRVEHWAPSSGRRPNWRKDDG